MLRSARRLLGGRSSKGETLFDKVLIANRGEIACRVMRTCKRLGIKTVAVYSEADARAQHVLMADEAYCVGPAPSIESYLVIENIMDAVHKSGAQAVHPGYGFLSENFRFCDALEKAGIEFVGPPVAAMKALGDKIESKILAKSLGVSVVPGRDGEIATEDELISACQEIGYPVMLKPSAGGGGKGMHVANNDDEAVRFFRLAKDEAKSSFGDDRMLVERFVSGPRHIEIQLIGDKHGNVVALSERECSIQRRNQKVLEESPSPFVIDEGPEFRRRMFDQAVTLAKKVDYHSAGTVEMMVDGINKDFFFLEMNTRLQVEHPVTEMVTGVDLVEQMLRVSAGHKLGFSQEDVQIVGHATEARVYAEDPLNDFLPTVGQLSRYNEPHGEGVRVDSGIREGDRISVYYDPMISKLITFAAPTSDDPSREALHATRRASIANLATALDSYIIDGLKSNVNLLRSLCDHPRYVSGEITTKFLPEEYPEGFTGYPFTPNDIRVLAHGLACRRAIMETARYSATSDSRKGPNAQLPSLRMVVEAHGWRFVFLVLASKGPVDAPPEVDGHWFDVAEVAVQAPDESGDAPTLAPINAEVEQLLKAPEAVFADHAVQTVLNDAANESAEGGRVRFRVFARSDARTFLFSSSAGEEPVTLQFPIQADDRKLPYYTPLNSGSTSSLGMTTQRVQYKGTIVNAITRSAAEALAAPIVPEPRMPKPGPEMLSPMSGVVVKIEKQLGQEVSVGETVIVLEAMKMRNEITAELDGVLEAVKVSDGDIIKEDDILFIIKPHEAAAEKM